MIEIVARGLLLVGAAAYSQDILVDGDVELAALEAGEYKRDAIGILARAHDVAGR